MDNFLIEVFSLDGLFEFYNQIHTFCQFVSGQLVPADNVSYSDVIDFGDRLERFAGHSGVYEMFGLISRVFRLLCLLRVLLPWEIRKGSASKFFDADPLGIVCFNKRYASA